MRAILKTGLGIFLALPGVAQAADPSCMGFANHVVSQLVKLKDGSSPNSLDALRGEFSTVQVQGDPKRPDLFVCKRKSGPTCLEFKLQAPLGDPHDKSWRLELPMQTLDFRFELRDGKCRLTSFYAQARNVKTVPKDCENPRTAYDEHKKRQWFESFIANVELGCRLGERYFDRSSKTSARYGGEEREAESDLAR